ncbi:MAG: hypothetical protein JWN02_2425, partial [Acidobacteria bacterium]|nr:hypothetical protein [Acidobacteriota bacterium]
MTLERIDDVLRCVADMGRPERRAAAARTVARHLGADDLIVFVRDADVGRSLPAPGFPQTLRGGRAWRELVKCAEEDGTAEGVVSDGAGELQQAEAMGLADGTVAVLLGRTASPPGKELLTILLPLIGDLLRSESLARRAEAESMLARQSARE